MREACASRDLTQLILAIDPFLVVCGCDTNPSASGNCTGRCGAHETGSRWFRESCRAALRDITAALPCAREKFQRQASASTTSATVSFAMAAGALGAPGTWGHLGALGGTWMHLGALGGPRRGRPTRRLQNNRRPLWWST